MSVTVTPDDVRTRAGVSSTEWPDARIAPVLAVAVARARQAQSDAALSGDAAVLWRSGVVAFTWNMLTSASTGGGGGQIKRVRDGDIETEFTTDKGGGGWLDEAYLFIPKLATVGRVSTLLAVAMERTDTCPVAPDPANMAYDRWGNPIVMPPTDVETVIIDGGESMTSVPFTVDTAGPSFGVDFGGLKIKDGTQSGMFGLSNLGPIFNVNITPYDARDGATVSLSTVDGDTQEWAVGDSGEIFFTPEPTE